MANPNQDARNSRGRYVATIEAAQRDAEVARLFALGWSATRLSERFKVTRASIYEMRQRALDRAGKQLRDAALAEELVKLDAREGKTLEVLERHHVVVSQGRVVCLDDEPIADDGPTLAALAELDRIAVHRARLLGLYAPTRTRIEVIDDDIAQALVEQLEAELAALTADPGGGVSADPPADI